MKTNHNLEFMFNSSQLDKNWVYLLKKHTGQAVQQPRKKALEGIFNKGCPPNKGKNKKVPPKVNEICVYFYKF